MKMRPEHLAHLKEAVKDHDTATMRERYWRQGLTDKRYRWDLTYRAGLTPWICANLYSYLDDSHIDTALKAIVKPL